MDTPSKPRLNIQVRQTGVQLQPSPMTSQKLAEKKMFLVRGKTMIPVTATYAKNSQSNVMMKVHIPGTKKTPSPPPPPLLAQMDTPMAEIKQEIPDEDSPGAVANVTESKPLRLDDLHSTVIDEKPENLWPDLKKEPESDLVLHLSSSVDDQKPSTSSSQPSSSQKRTRKAPTRYEDYVYEDPYDSESIEPEPEPKKMTRNPVGCRCEYVVPELESRMDRMMEKMHFIETLARTMISKEQSRSTERSQLQAAQTEIQQLRRQLSAAQKTNPEY